VITAVVAAVTPDWLKSVVGEARALNCVNGILCSPENTIFQSVKLCQIYSHALLTIVHLIYVISYTFSKIYTCPKFYFGGLF
jgi:hypothetical protein